MTSGPKNYYISLSLLLISVCIYNGSFHSTYKPDRCEYYVYSIAGDITSPREARAESLTLVDCPYGITIVTGIMTVFSASMIGVISTFDAQIAMKYTSIGSQKRIMAFFGKFNPFFIKLLNYIVFGLIVGQWIFIAVDKSCRIAKHLDKFNVYIPGLMWTQSIYCNGYTTFAWLLMYFLFARIRTLVYMPNYIYEPDKYDRSKVSRYLFSVFGP